MILRETMSIVHKWLDRVFGHEGGYVNNPRDPGGETKWGISKKSYPWLDIKNLKKEEAANIYIQDFLAPIKYERYHDGIGYQLFDFAVNSGPDRAIKKLQEAIGVTADGIVGKNTIWKLNSMSESDLIMLLIAYRIRFMVNLKNWDDAGRGWMRRMANNLIYGVEDSD